jgi:hypothetical protein
MLLAGALGISLLTLALIATQALEQTRFLWIAYGTFSSFGTLAYSQTAAGFPLALSGRANTAFNLMVFIGAFGIQWGLGLLIELLQTQGGLSVALAYRNALLTLLGVQLAAYAWFWLAGRRQNQPKQ